MIAGGRVRCAAEMSLKRESFAHQKAALVFAQGGM